MFEDWFQDNNEDPKVQDMQPSRKAKPLPIPEHNENYIYPSKSGRDRSSSNESRLSLIHKNMEIPIPSGLVDGTYHSSDHEFTHLRYTPIKSPANSFHSSITLRQEEINRETKIALVITMYNEGDYLFAKTIEAVYKNISYLCSEDCPDSWGPDGWKHFVVVVVADGITHISPRVLTLLICMGLYSDLCQSELGNYENTYAHLFQLTSQAYVNPALRIVPTTANIMSPVQMILLIKEDNAGKINSHRWFFEICKGLNPEVTLLLDVGTVPTTKSFYHLWNAMDKNPDLGGCCGEIKVELGKACLNLLNPLVASQNFEYKMSNILDKTLESVFGFISVLPGAFSCYRYKAILGVPLEKYFIGETMSVNTDIAKANMYLAEDRILCFELVTKRNENWMLKYVAEAKASTDVPQTLAELILQRRRWLNGTFFAAFHSLSHFTLIFRSNHTIPRKIFLLIEFFYMFVLLFFNWFAVGNFYLVFHFLLDMLTKFSDNTQSSDPFGGNSPIIFLVMRSLYIFLIITTIISSMGNRPQASKFLYHFTVLFFSAIMCMMLFLAVWFVILAWRTYYLDANGMPFVRYVIYNALFRNIFISVGSTLGLYVIISFFYLDPYHCFTCMVQYLILLPSYVNILTIYAFTNLHNISWGTKGVGEKTNSKSAPTEQEKNVLRQLKIPTQYESNAIWRKMQVQLKKNKNDVQKKKPVDEKVKNEDYFKLLRTRVVLLYIVTNGLLIIIFTSSTITDKIFSKNEGQISPYLTFLFFFMAISSVVRFTFSLIYLIQNWLEYFGVNMRWRKNKKERYSMHNMEEGGVAYK